MNDETTLRKAGARSDPYTVFHRKLAGGNPPDNWAALLDEAQRAETTGPSNRNG